LGRPSKVYFRHYVLLNFSVQSDEGHTIYGPCGTLVYCLGYQACIFSLSLEFCRQDPAPGYRKWFDANVTCARQAAIDAQVAWAQSSYVSETNAELDGTPAPRQSDPDANPGETYLDCRLNTGKLKNYGVCYGNVSLVSYCTASIIREKMREVLFIRAHLPGWAGDETGQQLDDAEIEFIVSDNSEIFGVSCPSPAMAERLG